MTTPADLAADAARRARRAARRESILTDTHVAPARTPGVDHFRDLHNAAHPGLRPTPAPTEPGVDPVPAPPIEATHAPGAPKPKRARKPKTPEAP